MMESTSSWKVESAEIRDIAVCHSQGLWMIQYKHHSIYHSFAVTRKLLAHSFKPTPKIAKSVHILNAQANSNCTIRRPNFISFEGGEQNIQILSQYFTVTVPKNLRSTSDPTEVNTANCKAAAMTNGNCAD